MSILKLEDVAYRYKDPKRMIMYLKILIMNLNKEIYMQ